MTPRHLLEPGRLAGAALLKAQSDGRLVDLTRAGNDRAFEAIVARYSAQLQRYCSRILPDGRGDDAVQQTFLKAYDAIHTDATPLSLRSWLFGIAHNVSLNILRQRGSDHEPLEAHDRADDEAAATIDQRERLREVLAALAALPANQRDALVLRELEGRGHDEIARELGVSGGAARQLISRARSGVREAAAAILPLPFVMRLTDGTAAHPTAERVAELTAVGAGVTVTKVVATGAIGATLLGGAITGPDLVEGDREPRSAGVADAAPSDAEDHAAGDPAVGADGAREGDRETRRGRGRSGDDDAREDDRRGRGRGRGRGGDDDGDNSGPGGGDDDDAEDDDRDSSGPGSGDDDDRETDDDSSGPGSGGDDDFDTDDDGDGDNSGPGSGGDEDDFEADDDNSGPGSGGGEVDVDDDVVESGGDDFETPDTDDGDNSGPGGGGGDDED